MFAISMEHMDLLGWISISRLFMIQTFRGWQCSDVQLFQIHDQKISGVGEESWAFLVGRYIYKVLQQLHGDGSSFVTAHQNLR